MTLEMAEQLRRFLDCELSPAEQRTMDSRMEQDEELYQALLELIAEREKPEIREFWRPVDRIAERGGHEPVADSTALAHRLPASVIPLPKLPDPSLPLHKAAAGNNRVKGALQANTENEWSTPPDLVRLNSDFALQISHNAAEWILSPDIFYLNEDFGLQTAHNRDNDKIMLKISPLRTSPLPTLQPVSVVFSARTMMAKETREVKKDILSPSQDDPSCGELVFDLSGITYLEERRIAIRMANEQFAVSFTHLLGGSKNDHRL